MPTAAHTDHGLARNGLLAALPAGAGQLLSPRLVAVTLEARQTLYDIGDRVAYVYFPAGCVVSGVAIMSDGATVETALVGPEGVTGLAALLGDQRARHWTGALLPGAALRLRADVLRDLFERDEAARGPLLEYFCALLNQVTRRAVCNTRHHLFERLCTWLLMVRDRAGRDDLPLTQEALSRQLGVRRAGVNEAVGRMQRAGAVEHGRGHVRVVDAARLEASACLCYRALRAEPRRPAAFADGGAVWP